MKNWKNKNAAVKHEVSKIGQVAEKDSDKCWTIRGGNRLNLNLGTIT